MRTRKYMHGKKRKVSPLHKHKEETSTSGVGATHETVSQVKKFINPKPKPRAYMTDRQLVDYQKHKAKINQPGGYHATEYQKGHKKKTNASKKTSTKTKGLKIPLGGVAGLMLIPKSAGKGSNVIDPKTGINKYSGKKAYTPF